LTKAETLREEITIQDKEEAEVEVTIIKEKIEILIEAEILEDTEEGIEVTEVAENIIMMMDLKCQGIVTLTTGSMEEEITILTEETTDQEEDLMRGKSSMMTAISQEGFRIEDTTEEAEGDIERIHLSKESITIKNTMILEDIEAISGKEVDLIVDTIRKAGMLMKKLIGNIKFLNTDSITQGTLMKKSQEDETSEAEDTLEIIIMSLQRCLNTEAIERALMKKIREEEATEVETEDTLKITIIGLRREEDLLEEEEIEVITRIIMKVVDRTTEERVMMMSTEGEEENSEEGSNIKEEEIVMRLNSLEEEEL
jgi:hypothetical protein